MLALRRSAQRQGFRFFSSSFPAFETLQVTNRAKGVAEVQLHRRDKSNAMSQAFFREITACFRHLGADASTRVVLLTGAGKNFCAGLDLHDHKSLLMKGKAGAGGSSADGGDVARKAFANMAFIQKYQDAITALERCPKPVIAAIHGACIGGGVDLVTAADVRYASSDAFFAIKEVDLGMAADIGTLQRLPRVVGSDSLARELVFTARRLPAAEAKECGLVSRVFPSVDELREAALALATEIATKSPVAVQSSKCNLVYARSHSIEDALYFQSVWNAAMLQSGDIPLAAGAMMKNVTPHFDDL